MQPYLSLVKDVLDNGERRVNERTGEAVISVFGRQQRYNLADEFPILRTKFTAFRLVASELLWFISGNTNIQPLLDDNNHIWDEWADENGDLGPVYGKQWRRWGSFSPDLSSLNDNLADGDNVMATYSEIDQLAGVIQRIKTNPSDRRLIVSAWNVGEIQQMALPPCHSFFQFYVSPSGKLSCQLYQRSNDIALGVPFNIASYALLTHMIAQICDLQVGEFIHTMGDAHIYESHIDGCVEMLERPAIDVKSQIILNPEIKHIDDFKMSDIKLTNYDNTTYHPSIKFKVAV